MFDAFVLYMLSLCNLFTFVCALPTVIVLVLTVWTIG